jgi:hypothetical protein
MFTDVLKAEVEFTDDIDSFNSYDGVKICYSTTKPDSGIFFQSSSLLFETGINEQNISIFEYENEKCFFSVGKESCLPFDPFAASFYLISRYEEYLPHIKDQHERFLSSESLAVQHKFLDVPLINIWINKIADIVESQSTSFKFPERHFEYLSTIDIDNAYAYKNKGFLRTIGGLLKSISQGNLSQRLKVLFGNAKDPYDTFDYLQEVHNQFNISPIYFFLLGDYGVNDKNIPVKNKQFQSLIKSVADYNGVGIHPSYASNDNIETLKKELNRLQEITHRNTVKSRQHFLKLNLPNTYRNLIDNDIEADYTMGYAETSGFRASIASPFFFYDLDTEVTTKLKVIPFTVMEATFQYYEKVGPEEALNKIKSLMQKVKDVKGTFVSVWHNESLCEEDIWKGWKMVYEQMIEEAIKE